MNIDFTTLALVSVLTTLATECVKKLFDKANKDYVSNIIATVMALVISAFLTVIKPLVIEQVAFSPALVYNWIVMAFFGVLTAMLGFDKVEQTIRKLGNK